MSVAIAIQGLGKSYGRVQALTELSLEIPRGAVFGLLGPNGAGKTTTFNILCGLTRPDRGSARVLGVDSQRVHTLRGRLGALPQDAAFPTHVTVSEQLAFLARLSGLTRSSAQSEARRVLELVDLDAVGRRRGGELSHGMHKRVALAQALLGNPEVILLDEPTAGLDPTSARQVKDLIAAQAPRATVIVSSHNLVEIQEICTHGAILDRGRLVRAGTMGELTHRGTEVTFEVEGGTVLPLAALRKTFGDASARMSGPSHVTLTVGEQEPIGRAITRALRALLDENLVVVGVTRGTSLEHAYLEATQEGPKQ
jgi:ABC-2 type transport system ATP-binding protein